MNTEEESNNFEGPKDDDDQISYSNLSDHDINISPFDYAIDTLISFIEKQTISIPEFQRYYVWSKENASLFIDSLLAGIPIPQIVLYQYRDKYLIIDGQQRLMTIYFFLKKRFPKKDMSGQIRLSIDREQHLSEKILSDEMLFDNFNLKLSQEDFPDLHGKNYGTLDEQYLSKFETKTIRCAIVKYLGDNTQHEQIMSELFKRINTGGFNLKPQEVRSSIHRCDFYSMLNQINLDINWRNLLNRPTINTRMRDIEILLRGFAILLYKEEYSTTPVKFLDHISATKIRNLKKSEVDFLHKLFLKFLDKFKHIIQERLITIENGTFNIPMFESIFYALCHDSYREKNFDSIDTFKDIEISLKKLKADEAFRNAVLSNQRHTKSNLKIRLNRAYVIITGKNPVELS